MTPMTEPVKSVLHDVQEARGATFRDDDGWYWTMSFGDGRAGYDAVCRGVGIWDVYPLVKWDVTGPDATAAIQRVFTADVTRQQVGQVKYAAFVDADGRFVDDGTVFKHADDHYWVLTNTSGFGDFWAEQSKGLDYTATNRTHDMPLISVQGPGSRDLLQSLTKTDLSDLRYFRFRTEPVLLSGVPVWISRTGFSGEVGFELFPARADAVAVWSALEEAGGVPIGLDTIEPVRIEAGLIIYGTDYTPGVDTPYDVSLDKMVALDGDVDFVGKAALAEVAQDPPNRLKTLRLHGSELPDAGAEVRNGGVPVGTLSSRIDSPTYGPIGLAMLRTAYATDGTELEVVLGDATVAATVAPLSLKDPGKHRPRA